MVRSKKNDHLLWISAVFSIAMAYLEATIVVYLRELYYPKGFHFPLTDIPRFIVLTEAGREIATIIMLVMIARMLANNRRVSFAYFMYNFGIWDIAYYIWLKILLDWPFSLLDWDVLFLIPVPWLSPVLAPLLVSLCLILAAIVILQYENSAQPLRFSKWEWYLELIAGIIIVLSFLTELDVISNRQIPDDYPWWLFAIGMSLGLAVFIRRIYLHRSGQVIKP